MDSLILLRNAAAIESANTSLNDSNPELDSGTDSLCRTALAEAAMRYKSVHGYLVVAVCVFGISANLVNIIVLTKKKMRSAVNALLTALAAAQLTLMCVYLPVGFFYYVMRSESFPTLVFFKEDRRSLYYALFYSTFSMMCHSVAVWETIAVATFRYLRLRFPIYGRQLCSMRNANIATGVVVAATALLSVPNWLSNGIVSANNYTFTHVPHCLSPTRQSLLPERGLWTIALSEFALSHSEVLPVNYWLQSLLVRLVPTALLATLTVLLIGIMRGAEKRRRHLLSKGEQDELRRAVEHNRTTGMLLAAVVLVLCIEVPHGVLIMVMLSNKSYEPLYDLIGDFIDITTLVAQSLNFFLYTAMSTQFRHTFFSLFCKKWSEQVELDWRSFTTFRKSMQGSQRSTNAGQTSDCPPSVDCRGVRGSISVEDAAERTGLITRRNAADDENCLGQGICSKTEPNKVDTLTVPLRFPSCRSQ